MRYLDLAVRRTLEVCALLAGGLLVLVALLLGTWIIANPGCTVDSDHADGVLVTRVLAGGWMVLEVLLAACVGTWFTRTDDTGWARVAVAAALPIGAVALWAVLAASIDPILEGIGAGPGASSCW